MDASDVLLDKWLVQVKQIWSQMHHYRQESLAVAILGIVLSGSAVLQRVAESLQERLSDSCQTSSYERRLQRLIANENIAVQASWQQFLAHSLPMWKHHEVILVLDCTPYQETFTIVFVGLLVQKRLLPLAWEVMPQKQTWEQGQWAIVARLFREVASHLSSPCVTLLADRGLTCLKLIELCKQQGWHYILRMQNDEQCRRKWRHVYRDWQAGKDFVFKKGMTWYGEVLVWQSHGFACTLSACWNPECEQAWFLLSDFPASPRQVRLYAWRMRVEATFQDTKSRRWCLESGQLRHREHLDRWLLLVFVAFWWTTHLGASCKHHGQAKLFDRSDRADKSVLRVGHLWLKELLKRANRSGAPHSRVQAARLANCLPFHRTKDGLRFSICLH